MLRIAAFVLTPLPLRPPRALTHCHTTTPADNFMSKGFVVGRSTYEAPARGGSLTSEWRSAEFDTTTLTKDGKTTHEQVRSLWMTCADLHALAVVTLFCSHAYFSYGEVRNFVD